MRVAGQNTGASTRHAKHYFALGRGDVFPTLTSGLAAGVWLAAVSISAYCCVLPGRSACLRVRRLRPVAGVGWLSEVVSRASVDLLMAALVTPGTVLLCSDSKAAVSAATSHRASVVFHFMTCRFAAVAGLEADGFPGMLEWVTNTMTEVSNAFRSAAWR